jgi:hypothetical protein
MLEGVGLLGRRDAAGGREELGGERVIPETRHAAGPQERAERCDTADEQEERDPRKHLRQALLEGVELRPERDRPGHLRREHA